MRLGEGVRRLAQDSEGPNRLCLGAADDSTAVPLSYRDTSDFQALLHQAATAF